MAAKRRKKRKTKTNHMQLRSLSLFLRLLRFFAAIDSPASSRSACSTSGYATWT
jgi:hypothetical protein